MVICPNCSYKLVLLQHRIKYKCALCSRLYLQKEIEAKEFREWNQRLRELDIEALKPKKRINKAKKKPKPRLSPEERRERRLAKKREWNLKNKESKRQWELKNKERRNEYWKGWRKSNLDGSRLKQRLAYWRTKQKELATQHITPSSIKEI